MASSFKTLTERLAQISLQLEALKEQDKQLREELMKLHEKGKVPTKFEANGFTFNRSEGRKTVVYDEALTDKIKRMQAYAVKMGRTTEKIGVPFWTIKAKPVKPTAEVL
jgi:adenine C2-methylase RlmN of 23S rRNA A2503 and tRNA A37